MKIGDYNSRIEFIPLTQGQDEVGDTVWTNGTSFKRWAKIENGGGNTTTIQNQSVGEQAWVFRTRYFPFSINHKIRFRDRLFSVTSFQNDQENDTELIIQAVEKRVPLTLQLVGRSVSSMLVQGV